MFLSQLSSGILSSIYYNDFFTIASDSIIYIIININNGWFIRILHVIGASLFILLILLHLIRAIWINSKIIHIKLITFMLIISGYLYITILMNHKFYYDNFTYYEKGSYYMQLKVTKKLNNYCCIINITSNRILPSFQMLFQDLMLDSNLLLSIIHYFSDPNIYLFVQLLIISQLKLYSSLF